MSTVLPDLSEALADAVVSAADGLVRVEGRDRLPATGIIWDAEGLIVTSHHVLERDENIKVGFQDGESVSAELIGRDPSTDLALLRTSKQGLKAPDWADPESLRVGHFALALGRPGATVRATMGIISALGKAWRTPAGGPVDRSPNRHNDVPRVLRRPVGGRSRPVRGPEHLGVAAWRLDHRSSSHS